MTTPPTPRTFWAYAIAFAIGLHVATVLLFASAIATGYGMRVVLALGITVVASVAWTRLLWRARTEQA